MRPDWKWCNVHLRETEERIALQEASIRRMELNGEGMLAAIGRTLLEALGLSLRETRDRADRSRNSSTDLAAHHRPGLPELCSPTMASLMRVANASIVNGLIIICMPGSRYPLRMTAFSA
jgi:hypothetical protein